MLLVRKKHEIRRTFPHQYSTQLVNNRPTKHHIPFKAQLFVSYTILHESPEKKLRVLPTLKKSRWKNIIQQILRNLFRYHEEKIVLVTTKILRSIGERPQRNADVTNNRKQHGQIFISAEKFDITWTEKYVIDCIMVPRCVKSAKSDNTACPVQWDQANEDCTSESVRVSSILYHNLSLLYKNVKKLWDSNSQIEFYWKNTA